MHFDYLVIGNGLMGSAAAKYLSQANSNVGLVGAGYPSTPKEFSVYSSHRDAARILRLVGKSDVWSGWEVETANTLKEMQKKIPWSFYEPSGCLYVQPQGIDNYLLRHEKSAKEMGIDCIYYNGEDLTKVFPMFSFPESANAVYEQAPAGIIKPLELIKAQNHLFNQNGGVQIIDVVLKVSPLSNKIIVHTAGERQISCNQVLLCTGSFTNFHELLTEKIELRLKSETTILAEVSKQTARELAQMPALLYEIKTDVYSGIYAIRPLQYPDGKYYVKMGCDLHNDRGFETLTELQKWFSQEEHESSNLLLRSVLQDLIPKMAIKATQIKPCVVCYTPSTLPYIQPLEERLFICTGGNGYSAMCSDALGKRGAELVLRH